MRAIAAKMEDLYCDHVFWDDMGPAIEYIQERKQPQQHPTLPPLEL